MLSNAGGSTTHRIPIEIRPVWQSCSCCSRMRNCTDPEPAPVGIPIRALDFSVVDNSFSSRDPAANSLSWNEAFGYCS